MGTRAKERDYIAPFQPTTSPSRTSFWDHRPTGECILVHPFLHKPPKVVIKNHVIAVACHSHLLPSQRPPMLGGSIAADPLLDELTLLVDAISNSPHSPLAPGNLGVPIKVSDAPEESNMVNIDQHAEDVQRFLATLSSGLPVDPARLIGLRINCCSAGASVTVTVSMVMPDTTFRLTPMAPVPVVGTSLARSLEGSREEPPSCGLLSLDVDRRLVVLHPKDSCVTTMPLVGIWVSQVALPTHPLVWASLMSYVFPGNPTSRLVFPPKPFLLVLYSPLHSFPEFYECHLTTGLPHLACQHHLGVHSLPLPRVPVANHQVFPVTLEKTAHRLECHPPAGTKNSPVARATSVQPLTCPRPTDKNLVHRPQVPDMSLLSDSSVYGNTAAPLRTLSTVPSKVTYGSQPTLPHPTAASSSTLSHPTAPSRPEPAWNSPPAPLYPIAPGGYPQHPATSHHPIPWSSTPAAAAYDGGPTYPPFLLQQSYLPYADFRTSVGPAVLPYQGNGHQFAAPPADPAQYKYHHASMPEAAIHQRQSEPVQSPHPSSAECQAAPPGNWPDNLPSSIQGSGRLNNPLSGTQGPPTNPTSSTQGTNQSNNPPPSSTQGTNRLNNPPTFSTQGTNHPNNPIEVADEGLPEKYLVSHCPSKIPKPLPRPQPVKPPKKGALRTTTKPPASKKSSVTFQNRPEGHGGKVKCTPSTKAPPTEAASTSANSQPTALSSPVATQSHQPAMSTPPVTSQSHQPAMSTPPVTSQSYQPTTLPPPVSTQSHQPAMHMPLVNSQSYQPAMHMPSATNQSYQPAMHMPPVTSQSYQPTMPTSPVTSQSHQPAMHMPSVTSQSYQPTMPTSPVTSQSHQPAMHMPPVTSQSHQPTTLPSPVATQSYQPAMFIPPVTSQSLQPAMYTPPASSQSYQPMMYTPPVAASPAGTVLVPFYQLEQYQQELEKLREEVRQLRLANQPRDSSSVGTMTSEVPTVESGVGESTVASGSSPSPAPHSPSANEKENIPPNLPESEQNFQKKLKLVVRNLLNQSSNSSSTAGEVIQEENHHHHHHQAKSAAYLGLSEETSVQVRAVLHKYQLEGSCGPSDGAVMAEVSARLLRATQTLKELTLLDHEDDSTFYVLHRNT